MTFICFVFFFSTERRKKKRGIKQQNDTDIYRGRERKRDIERRTLIYDTIFTEMKLKT